MTSRQSLPTREPDEKIPDGSLGFFSVAAGALPATKFLLAVVVAELIRKGKTDADPYEDPRRPTGPDTVRLPEDSGPLLWLPELFGIEPDPAFLRELLGVVFRYTNHQGLVVKPVFMRIESRTEICSRKDGIHPAHDLTLYVEPAFADHVREHLDTDELEAMLGWPVGLLKDILCSVWAPPEKTFSGAVIGLWPTQHRTSYIVRDKPTVCPFCGSEPLSTIETGFFGDQELKTASDHGLISPIGCLTTEFDPNWECRCCRLSLKLPNAPYRYIRREEIERQLQQDVDYLKAREMRRRHRNREESLEDFLAKNK